MESIIYLLDCLGYNNKEEFDISSNNSLLLLICWLEDQKIREYTIEERIPLRLYSNEWNNHFQNYLNILGCPYLWNPNNPLLTLHWLISYAVRLEYEDIGDQCINMEETNEEIDIELSTQINELGNLIGIQRLMDESDSDLLDRIYQTIRYLPSSTSSSNLSSSSTSLSTTKQLKSSQNYISEELNNFQLGFTTHDSLVDKVAIVLKMLHLFDLRQLQSELNSLIVLGQEYTANPKTNAALGQVGR